MYFIIVFGIVPSVREAIHSLTAHSFWHSLQVHLSLKFNWLLSFYSLWFTKLEELSFLSCFYRRPCFQLHLHGLIDLSKYHNFVASYNFLMPKTKGPRFNPAGNYMVKANRRNTRVSIIGETFKFLYVLLYVVLVSLFLTSNIFHTLFYCFYC